ncbi:hypothetical protein MOF05_20835 [Bacillus haynesii]|uniref:hypothetical protein n=1 Tax=Bacillus haynesii TaxID=1925021 RepID=UPI00227E0F3F|nr:hypothetical protein [Bacillus haynesii]MCY9290799.1 hypothetical protein [Bacillus haynesii]MEC0685555.1 hypothetical protein [Bacillus haynesii]MEC0764467.1 hypothetical protein [Bacillus haynesii]
MELEARLVIHKDTDNTHPKGKLIVKPNGEYVNLKFDDYSREVSVLADELRTVLNMGE